MTSSCVPTTTNKTTALTASIAGETRPTTFFVGAAGVPHSMGYAVRHVTSDASTGHMVVRMREDVSRNNLDWNDHFMFGDCRMYGSHQRHIIPAATNGACYVFCVSELSLQLPLLASKQLPMQAGMVLNMFDGTMSFVKLGVYDMPLAVAGNGHVLTPISGFLPEGFDRDVDSWIQ